MRPLLVGATPLVFGLLVTLLGRSPAAGPVSASLPHATPSLEESAAPRPELEGCAPIAPGLRAESAANRPCDRAALSSAVPARNPGRCQAGSPFPAPSKRAASLHGG